MQVLQYFPSPSMYNKTQECEAHDEISDPLKLLKSSCETY